MNIEIDLTPIIEFLSLSPEEMAISLFLLFGWIPISIIFLWGSYLVWIDYRSGVWSATNKFIFLAIDIPKNNQQSPKAVENLFTYLAGAHGSFDLIEEYWIGMFQLSFSFEIVSIDGYTQFLIRTPEKFRNLVETAIYSQYPDAEMTEVSDYTDMVPSKFPDAEWDIWGAEFMYVKPDAYPLKTYEQFEHNFGEPEMTFKDPLATLMDLNSTLGDGEQLWFQILVKPTGFDLPGRGDKEIKKLLKEKTAPKENIIDKLLGLMFSALTFIADIFSPAYEKSSEEKKDESLSMMDLKPADIAKVEAITRKINKIAFDAKIRVVYVAKKNVMNKPKVVNGVVGYIKQFSDMNLNNLKPDTDKTMTSAKYFFKKSTIIKKKNSIIRAYKSRSTTVGRLLRAMTIDELATLWHFPVDSVVKAPLIQKASGRKVEPPMSLPMSGGERGGEENFESDFKEMIRDSQISKDKGESQDSGENSNPRMESIFIDEDSKENFKKDILSNNDKKTEERDKTGVPNNLPFV